MTRGQTATNKLWLVVLQTTTMMPAVAEDEQSSPEESASSAGSKEDEMNNKHVLRQAQLARELQQLNEMLADKQQLAGQMMRSDEQLASVKLQYEVSTKHTPSNSSIGPLIDVITRYLWKTTSRKVV